MTRKFRRSAKSFADMLPWQRLVDEGTVITKHGSYVTGFYFSPPDNDSSTEFDEETVAENVNRALRIYGSGWASWGDVVSFPSGNYPPPEVSYFPDDFSRAVDNARRKKFEQEGEHYDNERVLCVGYKPPPEAVRRLSDMMFYESGGKEAVTEDKILNYFNRTISDMLSYIGRDMGLRRMQSLSVRDNFGQEGIQDEFINYLNFCVSGKLYGVILPSDSGAYIDHFIATQENWVGENPIVGRDYIAVVTIDGFPEDTQPNVISGLNSMGIPYRFSQRMIYLDTHQAVKEITVHQSRWGQQKNSVREKIVNFHANRGGELKVSNKAAAALEADASLAIKLANSADVRFGYYSPAVVLRHSDPRILDEWCNRTVEIINSTGFSARIEETNTQEAWLATFPGDIYSNVRRPLAHTRTLANLLPLTGIWTGYDYAPCQYYPKDSPPLFYAVTHGKTPFRGNLHIGPSSMVGHTLILGPTRTGKSSLSNMLALQARRYEHMRITAFDYKRGMQVTALACGGLHYDLALEMSEGMFCPFGVLDTNEDIEWAADYAAILYEYQTGHPPLPDLTNAIFSAITTLANINPRLRSMTNFVETLQDKEARQAYNHYTIRGGGGGYLDGTKDWVEDDNDFVVFETMDLMQLGMATSMPVLLYQFRRFERSLRFQSHPSILFIAEAWQVFQHKQWSERLAKWLRILAGKNCAVVMDTQSLADVIGSSILPLLNESCQRKIFLANPAATQGGSRELYTSLGMNDRQIHMIAKAIPREHYYFTGPDGCRMISLGLGPLELAVAGATSEPDIVDFQDALKQYGPDKWLTPFLLKHGVSWKPEEKKLVHYA